MSAIVVLMGLLVLSYVGSLLAGKHGSGTSSHLEFLALGVVIGPHALGLIDRDVLSQFGPLIQAALAWFAFAVGLEFGRVGGQRVPPRTVVLGVLLSSGCCLLISGGVWVTLRYVSVPYLSSTQTTLFAIGVGAVLSETSRSAIRWVTARHDARGPLAERLSVWASADDLVPIAVVGLLFAYAPHDGVRIALPSAVWMLVSGAVAVLIAGVSAVLLRDAEGYQVWGALGGIVLVALGVNARFGLSPMFGCFLLGITLAAITPNARALRRLVSPTERPVMLPLLLLAGARLDVRTLASSKLTIALLLCALLWRVALKYGSGLLLRQLVPTARGASLGLGLGLLSAGPITLTAGLTAALRFSGVLGDALLALAVAAVVIGEALAPRRLHRELLALGEVQPPAAPSSRSAGALADAPSQPAALESAPTSHPTEASS